MKRLRTLTRKSISTAKETTERQPIKGRDIITLVLCLLSLTSFVSCIIYINDVLIDIRIPILLGSFCGLIGIFFTKKRENYFYAFLGYGSFIVGVPFFINGVFADSKFEDIKLPIKEKHHSVGKHGPSVDVKFEGINKEINVDSDSEMDSSAFVRLRISKGALGFYIIRENALMKN
jgi:hypothetical protein